MKKVLRSKHTYRTLGFIAALIVLAAVIFLFTRPLLAPELKVDDQQSQAQDNSPSFSSNPDNPQIGQGVVADSYLLFDEDTGKILASRNPDAAVAIASITKLMTAYLTQKYGDLNDTWAVPANGPVNINPVLGLAVGDRVKVQDLVNGMLVGSANDAANNLGLYLTSIKGKPMVDLMNTEAKSLGMNSTHYENPIGFDSEQNYSTANDLKILLDTIRPIKLFSDLDRKQSYTFTGLSGKTYSVKATNTLLASDPDIHAIKTGFTDEAKGAMITAIHHEDKHFVIIVLGSTNRESDTKLLKANMLKYWPESQTQQSTPQ